ncbi:MAG: molybdopterin-synthase adenylyltransferase MoeB [Elusimicrobia bacterium]|nr:molybdopterin-synthase adenylyltransferase MoeB [Elusimicrobiota bacterium]
MPVKVMLPTALRAFADRQEAVELEGATVGEVLGRLAGRYAKLKEHLYTGDGKLRNFVNVYVNDEDIRHLKGPDTAVKAGDTVLIVPSIAGGSATAALPALSREELQRYHRHIIMPEVGTEGQARLKKARVLAIGAGGLGSPYTLYLAAAGVGTIGIVDFDTVDATNLQRQILYSSDSIGKPKLAEAKARLKALNPHIEVEPREERLTSQNALELFKRYDVVADGTDNFPTRYLVNDACVLAGKPNVYGSIFRFEGQVSVFDGKSGPCYRCLYPEPPPPGLVPSCAEGGVFGVLPGVIGTLQAVETLKLILGVGKPLIGRLMLFDALNMEWRTLKTRKDPGCPLCGNKPTITGLIDYEAFCNAGAPPAPAAVAEISVEELKGRLDRREPFVLVDVREPHEYEIARIPGSLLIPLGQLPERLSELSKEDDLVVHCKMGGRSMKAAKLLLEKGFKRVTNVAGGINAWSERVDPNVPKY